MAYLHSSINRTGHTAQYVYGIAALGALILLALASLSPQQQANPSACRQPDILKSSRRAAATGVESAVAAVAPEGAPTVPVADDEQGSKDATRS